MDIPCVGKEKLIVPTDFVKSKVQEKLVPPSHFASTVPSAGAQRATGGKMPATATPINWAKPSLTSLPTADHNHSSYWLAISQTQQEILELKKANQKLMMQPAENLNTNKVRDLSARPVEQSEEWASQWRLEAENYKAETERLKGQVQTLKETTIAHREEIRDKDIILDRQAHELELVREELRKTKAELGFVREELSQTRVQKESLTSQFDHINKKSSEEIQKLNKDLQISRDEAKDLSLKADLCRLQAEEAIKEQTEKLSKQLEEWQKNQETEVEKLTALHQVLQLKGRLTEVSAEKDSLKDHLSQMRQAFETQSATLHSLRNYIGQLAPRMERRTDLMKQLRLNSVNEILALQEDKIIKKNSTDSFVKNGSESVHVLQLWREKVFKLCVQLRTKDIELRGEKHELLSQITAVEQQLKQEQHRTGVLQHSLEDKTAALDLEQFEKETLKQDLAQTQKKNPNSSCRLKKTKNTSTAYQNLHKGSV
ncbi:hypothetical protein WMY93_007893 [Mugilogobius chulae]|uniref:Coiled-coil alpha-helical rod protein 1 n=1 Tax=Mugilogobius chulae TaxID=88201 RepID=A0AAW0PHN6_9GOBI